MDLGIDLNQREKLGTVTYELFRELQTAEVYESNEGYLVKKRGNGHCSEQIEKGSYECSLIEGALNGHSNVRESRLESEKAKLGGLIEQF